MVEICNFYHCYKYTTTEGIVYQIFCTFIVCFKRGMDISRRKCISYTKHLLCVLVAALHDEYETRLEFKHFYIRLPLKSCICKPSEHAANLVNILNMTLKPLLLNSNTREESMSSDEITLYPPHLVVGGGLYRSHIDRMSIYSFVCLSVCPAVCPAFLVRAITLAWTGRFSK